LILELNELWKRLSEIHNNNVKSLNAQRNEFDVVLDTIEDPIVVLDHLGKIEHHNKYFANLVGAKGHSLNFQAWNDVSLSSLTYLHLRNLLRIENMEETLFWTAVDHSDKIFRLRKRYIFDSNKKRCGTIFILHDITHSFSSEKFKEITLKLKDSQSK
jgi:PAS domain S-box-containing protein